MSSLRLLVDPRLTLFACYCSVHVDSLQSGIQQKSSSRLSLQTEHALSRLRQHRFSCYSYSLLTYLKINTKKVGKKAFKICKIVFFCIQNTTGLCSSISAVCGICWERQGSFFPSKFQNRLIFAQNPVTVCPLKSLLLYIEVQMCTRRGYYHLANYL